MRNRGEISDIKGRKIIFKSLKLRGKWEIVLQILENREKKGKSQYKNLVSWEDVFSKSWKSRGERDMKIHFSSQRGKTNSKFSSRISRDRDSCQGLIVTLEYRVTGTAFAILAMFFFYKFVSKIQNSFLKQNEAWRKLQKVFLNPK